MVAAPTPSPFRREFFRHRSAATWFAQFLLYGVQIRPDHQQRDNC